MNQDQNSDKNSTAILWGIAGIFILCGLIWYFFSYQLKSAFLWFKLMELKLLSLFVYNLDDAIDQLELINPASLTFADFDDINMFVGNYSFYPLLGFSAILVVLLFKGHVALKYNRVLNLKDLAKAEAHNYPQIMPVLKADIIKKGLDEGPWAMSITPMLYAKKYDLLEVEVVADNKALWRSEGVHRATLINDKATRLFYHQMGAPWQGIGKLSRHAKALFAVFAARIEHDSKSAEKLLKQFSRSSARGRLDISGVDEVIHKHIKSKAVQRVAQKHAYVATVMASMLDLARTDGVLPTADFLWLKATDRCLWYMLSSVGRQVAFVECAGPFSHWLAEKEMARPLHVPVIDEATTALKKALDAIVYTPDEEDEKK